MDNCPPARLLRDSLEDELGGTQQGRQLSIVSRNLVNTSVGLEQALTSSPDTFPQAYRDVHQTLSALEDEFQSVYFSAPNSSAIWTVTRAFSSHWRGHATARAAATIPPRRT